MRTVPSGMTDTWLSGEYTGDARPMARVTIQRLQIQVRKIDPRRHYASAMFGQGDIPQELPNVKSVVWNRSIGQDAASCTIVFYNTFPLPLGEAPDDVGSFDLPGYYTANYDAGDPSFPGFGTPTGSPWQDYLIPDRVLRTFEGYGVDTDAVPEDDSHLVLTGVWLIDDVEYGTDGLITVTCRDLGRLLLDQVMFPPVIPLARYPMKWDKQVTAQHRPHVSITGSVIHPAYETDSGVPYNGLNGAIYGHRGSHAFDNSNNTYWLSIGNDRPESPYSFEYVQGKLSDATVAGISFKAWGGPYRVYVSVKIGGVWQGRSKIPYDPTNPVSAPNGADIEYVTVGNVSREGTRTFSFASPYHHVQSVRLTFTHLSNSGLGPFPYRAGVRDFKVSATTSTTTPGGHYLVGDYDDYSEIVKYLLACGGFWWPKDAAAFNTHSDGLRYTDLPTGPDDPFLKKGRIWGDIMLAGKHSAGPAQLDITIWDKKPLMDGVAYVRDILGFIFFVDETGGAVFRLPNIYRVGNYIGDNSVDAGYNTDDERIIEIDETQVLINLRARLSSKDIREYVFVATTDGKYGAVSAGYNPVHPDPGLRRVGGWTDQYFASTKECLVMADLITIRQMFEYRSDTLTIAAFPAIQIDDQVRIHERITGEGFLHYVKGIQSTNDLEKGNWTYTLDTHWLGEHPLSRWAFSQSKLNAATKDFIKSLTQV